MIEKGVFYKYNNKYLIKSIGSKQVKKLALEPIIFLIKGVILLPYLFRNFSDC